MSYADFSLVVEGLVATGMAQNKIARALRVSPSTVCRWREGLAEPRVRTADALLELAEAHTAKVLRALRQASEQ